MNNILPDFQKHILDNKLVPENQVPFYDYWVNKFISFSNQQQDIALDLRIQLFIDALKKDPKLEDWQITQGADGRDIQDLLSHKNVETTMIYTHVLRNMSKAPVSPLDTLLSDKE